MAALLFSSALVQTQQPSLGFTSRLALHGQVRAQEHSALPKVGLNYLHICKVCHHCGKACQGTRAPPQRWWEWAGWEGPSRACAPSANLSFHSGATASNSPSKGDGDCGFNLLPSFVQSLYKKVSPQLFLLGKAQVEHRSISDTQP